MKYKVGKYEPSEVKRFRDKWLKKGYELIDMMPHVEVKLGHSGWCNDINEPNENIYHFQVWYRYDIIANVTGKDIIIIDEDKYVIFITNEKDFSGADFVIYRKCKIQKNTK